MKEYRCFNPYVILLHFVFVVGMCMVAMHPLVLMSALLSGLSYALVLSGKKAVKRILMLLPTALVIALVNPLFNHQGVTALFYLPSGNPVTFEAVIFGLLSGVMLISVVLWFSCFNEVFKSDKILYVFGRILPSLAMVVSMSLRFVPRLIHRCQEMLRASRAMGRDIEKGSVKARLKIAGDIFSAVMGWAMENSVETAKSMKCRGYGKGKRTAYSIYSFDGYDAVFLIFLAACLGIVVIFPSEFSCYPMLNIHWKSIGAVVYAMVCFAPVVIDLAEVRKWRQ